MPIRNPRLTPEEREHWNAYAERREQLRAALGRDPTDAEQVAHLGLDRDRSWLIEHGRRYVQRTLRRIAPHLPPGIELEDLEGEAHIGLVKAVDEFEPDRRTAQGKFPKFYSAAIPAISGRILDMLRSVEVRGQKRSGQNKAKRIERATALLRAALGREPEPAELAAQLGVNEAGLEQLRRDAEPLKTQSLESGYITDTAEQPDTLLDLLAAADPALSDQLEQKELAALVNDCLGALPVRQRQYIRLRYLEGVEEARAVARIARARHVKASQVRREVVGPAVRRFTRLLAERGGQKLENLVEKPRVETLASAGFFSPPEARAQLGHRVPAAARAQLRDLSVALDRSETRILEELIGGWWARREVQLLLSARRRVGTRLRPPTGQALGG